MREIRNHRQVLYLKKKNSSEMQIVQLQRGNECFHLVLLSVKPLSSPLHRPWCWTCDHSSDVCLFSRPTNCFDPVGRCCYISTPVGVPGSLGWEGASAESLSVAASSCLCEHWKNLERPVGGSHTRSDPSGAPWWRGGQILWLVLVCLLDRWGGSIQEARGAEPFF